MLRQGQEAALAADNLRRRRATAQLAAGRRVVGRLAMPRVVEAASAAAVGEVAAELLTLVAVVVEAVGDTTKTESIQC